MTAPYVSQAHSDRLGTLNMRLCVEGSVESRGASLCTGPVNKLSVARVNELLVLTRCSSELVNALRCLAWCVALPRLRP